MRVQLDGNEIICTDAGRGLPLLFVHGFPLSRRVWTHQVAAFAPAHRVLAPDLRGLGESPLGTGEVSIAAYADDLAALVRRLDTGPVVLAGHSMGGYVALAFARAHPELLRGLVLVATRAVPDSPEAAAGRRATAAEVERDGMRGLATRMASQLLAPEPDDPELRAEITALIAASAPAGVVAALHAMAARPDASPLLPTLRVPTLVITGDADSLIPRAADVCLKEGRPLLLAVRETPLHSGHLELMGRAARAGAIIFPPVPAFYHRPTSLDDVINQTVNRVLDQFDIELPEDLFTRWQGA